jgi:hypothetical protein
LKAEISHQDIWNVFPNANIEVGPNDSIDRHHTPPAPGKEWYAGVTIETAPKTPLTSGKNFDPKKIVRYGGYGATREKALVAVVSWMRKCMDEERQEAAELADSCQEMVDGCDKILDLTTEEGGSL